MPPLPTFKAVSQVLSDTIAALAKSAEAQTKTAEWLQLLDARLTRLEEQLKNLHQEEIPK
jgi:NAD-specific glutamate dehydrogenase